MNEYRIQRLKEDLTYAQQRNKHQKQQLANYKKVHEKDLKEIERLNNIINELDTFLKNKIDNFDKDVKDTILHEQMTIRVIYDYLQMVKGDSSND